MYYAICTAGNFQGATAQLDQNNISLEQCKEHLLSEGYFYAKFQFYPHQSWLQRCMKKSLQIFFLIMRRYIFYSPYMQKELNQFCSVFQKKFTFRERLFQVNISKNLK